MDLLMISAFIMYFTLLICIGSFFYKKNASASEFMLGNRSVNYWVTAIATQSSDMGSWLFLGFPAMVFTHGLFQFWTAIGLITGMFLTWQFVAPQLRTVTGKLKSLTLSSYLTERFSDRTGIIGILSALFSLMYIPFYIASGLVGLSILFETAFGIDYHSGILISVVTVCLYTLIGGFVAVAWCDFFQGIFLLGTIIFVPLYALTTLSGIQEITDIANLKHISLSLISNPNDMIWAILLAAGWGLGYFGQPHILVNFMGIDDVKKIKLAKRVGMTWQILVLSAAACIGLIGIAFFKNGLADSQLVFINMTTTLFHPFIAGLILCAILAATLSTMDSLILVGGSTFAQDIYKPLVFSKPNSSELLWASRLGSIAVSLIALKIGWTSTQSVYELVNYAWSGLGSCLGPVILMSLFWKKTTKSGALAGILVGGLLSGLWPYFGIQVLPLAPCFLLSLITIFIGSLATKK